MACAAACACGSDARCRRGASHGSIGVGAPLIPRARGCTEGQKRKGKAARHRRRMPGIIPRVVSPARERTPVGGQSHTLILHMPKGKEAHAPVLDACPVSFHARWRLSPCCHYGGGAGRGPCGVAPPETQPPPPARLLVHAHAHARLRRTRRWARYARNPRPSQMRGDARRRTVANHFRSAFSSYAP